GERCRGLELVCHRVGFGAGRARQSTTDIYHVVNALVQRSEASVQVAGAGAKAAEVGLERMQQAEQTLHDIAASVGSIADMALQMATAVEEQAQVSEQINDQVTRISGLSDDSMSSGQQSATEVRNIRQVAEDLHDLVVRFR